MRILVLCLLSLSLISCGTLKSKRGYLGDEIDNKYLANLYMQSSSSIRHGIYQANYKVTNLTGSGVDISDYKGVVSLKPGTYTLNAEWRKFVDGGNVLLAMPNGGVEMYHRRDSDVPEGKKYLIELHVKAGMTYVLELNSTTKYPDDNDMAPNKLCVTEEKHDAEGHWTPLYKDLSRSPSDKAKIVACST